jgi:ABC-2 type transport system permease protein
MMPICWKACLEKKYSLAGWTAGILVYMIILGWYYPSFAEAGEEMQALIDRMPKDMWAIFGLDESVDMLSPSGFLTAEAFGMMLPISFSIFAMGIGSRAIGGEETDGTLELLVTLPITRQQLYFQKFAALVILVATLGLLLWLGVLFASTWGGMALGIGPVAGSSVMVALLGLFFGAVTLTAGAITGRRTQTVAIGSTLIVVTFLFKSLATMIDSLSALKWLSPFYYYNEGLTLDENLLFVDTLPLVGGIIVLTIAGLIGFERRDLCT